MIALAALVRVFGRIGCLSFGGPAAQIALMHHALVEERGWLTERQFLGALSFCMVLPGPEAMQLATYAGWRLRGVTGGLIAGGLFVLPGAAVIMALALVYLHFGTLPLVQALFLGVQAAVVVIVAQALLKVSHRALKTPQAWTIALLGFVALFAFAVPFPVVIALAALWGGLTAPSGSGAAPRLSVRPAQTVGTVALGLSLWVTPLALSALAGATLLTQIGLFFSRLAVVTFGGAYAVLAYMTQSVVQQQGWLTTDQMMDALGLAETTPGPLILVTQFVGALAMGAQGGSGDAILGAAMTLWVTFVPCFIWIFAFAPYIEWIIAQPRLKGALDAIMAAVVGVIGNLTLWFAAHVMFAEVGQRQAGPVALILPVWHSLDPVALGLGALAALLLLRLHWGLLRVLAVMALAGLALSWIG